MSAAQAHDDPWAEADTATYDESFIVYGQVDLTVEYVILQKGVGKVPFDPSQHEIGDRRLSIEITIIPVVPGRQPISRNMLSQSREWANIVNPSIKALGPNWSAQMLRDKYVEAQMVNSGRKYTHRESGETRDATTIKFLRVFGNEEECAAAASARFGPRPNGGADRPLPEDGAENPQERATAAKFLEPLWRSCNGDADKFSKLLASNAMLARHFTLTSDEVMALMLPASTPGETLPF